MSKLGPTIGLIKYVPMSVMSELIGLFLFLSLAICAISVVIDQAPLTSSCMTIPCVLRVVPVPDGEDYPSNMYQ